jgi:hypothetical protein
MVKQLEKECLDKIESSFLLTQEALANRIVELKACMTKVMPLCDGSYITYK